MFTSLGLFLHAGVSNLLTILVMLFFHVFSGILKGTVSLECMPDRHADI